MIWERDYMKRRSSGDANAADTTRNDGPTPDPTDIFAGVERQALSFQAPPNKASSDSKTDNSARALGSPVPQAAGQPELPLNRLLAKHPRFFWYVAIAILGIIIGILLAREL